MPCYHPPGKGAHHYIVGAVSCPECPAAYITADSLYLIQMDSKARQIHEAHGAALMGADASRWPAWWADAVAEIQLQHNLDMLAFRESLD